MCNKNSRPKGLDTIALLVVLSIVIVSIEVKATSEQYKGISSENNNAEQVPAEVYKIANQPAYPKHDEAPRILLEASSTSESDIKSDLKSTENFQALRRLAASQGIVRVIVGVRVPFAAEGKLTHPSVEQQRNDIADSQSRIFKYLGIQGISGAQVTDSISTHNVRSFSLIPFMALTVTLEELEALSQNPEVISIEEDRLQTPFLNNSVPYIGGDKAWAAGFSGAGQTVAILDTGVDKNHMFLSGKVLSEACYSSNVPSYGSSSLCPGGAATSDAPGSGINCDPNIVEECMHGTHVAGIVAGKPTLLSNGATVAGVAKDANLIAIQVFSEVTNPSHCGPTIPCVLSFNSDQVAGLERVFSLRSSFNISAVNMSLGGGRYFNQSSCDAQNAASKAAIDNLRSVGIATVIASGNDGYSDSLRAPGCISSGVSVGSTAVIPNLNNNCQGNNLGVTVPDSISCFSNSSFFLNLLAPGYQILSSIPTSTENIFHYLAGTSMAAPHVAGAWAVLKQKSPAASVDDVLSAFVSTGTPITDPRNGIIKPRINVFGAVNALPIKLKLSVSKTGLGTVISSPTGIKCGTTCSAGFVLGSQVTLTASPSNGYYFGGWGGACSGIDPCVVTMDAAKHVTAKFNTTYLLSIPKPSTGVVTSDPAGINCGGINSLCKATFTTVTLTATPIPGYGFRTWVRCPNPEGNKCLLILSKPTTIKANFYKLPTYKLNVIKTNLGVVTGEPGGINCGMTNTACGVVTLNQKSEYNLTATPNPGFYLKNWVGCPIPSGTTCKVVLNKPVTTVRPVFFALP